MASVKSRSDSNILHKVFRGIEKPRFLLLQVNDEIDSNAILSTFFKSALVKQKLYLLESNPTAFDLPSHIEVIDLFSSLTFDGCNLSDRILANIALESVQPNTAVFIDSLNSLITFDELPKLSHLLNQLLSKYEFIISTISSGLLDEVSSAVLHRIATTIVDLKYNISLGYFEADTIHKKKNKRIGFTVSQFKENFTLDDKVGMKPYVASTINILSQDVGDKLTDLTFNLTLNDSELKAKDQLTLPYTK